MNIELCNVIDFILNYKSTIGVELFHFDYNMLKVLFWLNKQVVFIKLFVDPFVSKTEDKGGHNTDWPTQKNICIGKLMASSIFINMYNPQ
jgi:hypothetical protein